MYYVYTYIVHCLYMVITVRCSNNICFVFGNIKIVYFNNFNIYYNIIIYVIDKFINESITNLTT